MTDKRDEILGVVNELEADYAAFTAFYDENVAQQERTTNTFMQEALAAQLQEGERDNETAIRQAIDLLREFADKV